MTEAELLFSQILNCRKLDLYLERNKILHDSEAAQVASALKRRMCGEPIQYILGKTEFMGLEFKVTPDVFIPRPETEILVEKIIDIVSAFSGKQAAFSILELGTGSGCIAIALAKYLPGVKIAATDISERALEVARENARINNVEINFLQGDLFSTNDQRLTANDLVVSNPPYISTDEIGRLQPEIQYEPKISLDGGRDGLHFYRRIIAAASDYLKEKGLLIMEMGFGLDKAIKNILNNSHIFEIIEVSKDYHEIERVIVAQRG